MNGVKGEEVHSAWEASETTVRERRVSLQNECVERLSLKMALVE